MFEVLRPYHETIGELIPRYGGTLEHFAGDGIMVFFNDPVAVEDHELAAIRLALAAQERFEELARGWRKRGTELGLGIGIEAGYATVGRIGFEGATTTRRSGRSRTSPLGSAPTPRRGRSWSARGSSRPSRRRSSPIPSGAST